ncbi:MAG: hypothetical protein ABH834_05880 [Candidatus Altiarchaeota archaeon]
MVEAFVDRQMILGAAMILAAFPLRMVSEVYFKAFGDDSGFTASMLFYSLAILGGALVFYSFMRWRVARVRAAREIEEDLSE